MIDTIIEGATIYDGLASPPFSTDVALVADRIVLIGSFAERDAHERISGIGLALAPGFIDVQTHGDEAWALDGRRIAKIRQGVTTEVAGNCGTSAVPIARDATAPWRDLDELFADVNRSGVALNVATLVGLGSVRRAVAGDVERALDATELRRECELVREAIEQGALGISSGPLEFNSRYPDFTELVACASAARDAGMARYVTHLRSEGEELLEAVDEALEVARRAEVGVRFSHHRAAGKKNWGKVDRSLETMARARASGVDIGANAYPYVTRTAPLATILPLDALHGGRRATLARLRDPATAAALALRLKLDRVESEWHDIAIVTVSNEQNADLVGRRLDEIADRRRISPARAALDILLADELAAGALFFDLREDDVATVLSADFVAVGSDAPAHASNEGYGITHPSAFGCFPRLFGRYVRGRATLALGEAIRRMTSLAAESYGLRERGRVATGLYADLVLFDPATIVDTATYERPEGYPVGISYVWVNGRAVVRRGEATGTRPGRILRGSAA